MSDVSSPHIAFIGGFGSGKTYAACYKALGLACANPDTAGMLVSPTFPMLRDTTRRTFLEILQLEEVSYELKITENKIRILEPNAEIWFRSADDPNKLKGSNLAWVGLDEAAQMSKEAYDISLSRMRDPKANIKQLFITTTPEGFNWVYDISQKIKMVHSSTEDNVYLDKDYVEMLYSSYDEQLVKQYIKGEFVLLNKGRVYYCFDRNIQLTDITYNPSLPINLCVDFNINPMCWAIVQTVEGVDVVVDEIVLRNANTELAANTFINKYPDKVVSIYGDYSGTFRHTSSPTTDYDIIKSIIKTRDINIKPDPPVTDRVNSVNSRLRNSKGDVRLKINRNCKTTIRDFEQVVYKEGKREIDKSSLDLTHISDAIGYRIEYLYPIRGRAKVTQYNLQ
ncbi:MAG: hypothetical protein IPJ03_15825 [Ignavibacteriales bacterium]|nr:hypothetical protein [Ignavibacteriales bacterium]